MKGDACLNPGSIKELMPDLGKKSSEGLRRLLQSGDWYYEHARRLVAEGVDINGRNERGVTPLFEYLAWGGRDMTCITGLLSLGADPTACSEERGIFSYLSAPEALENRTFATAFLRACQRAAAKGGDLSMYKTGDESPLILTLRVRESTLTPEYVREFAEAGVDVNGTDSDGKPALYLALEPLVAFWNTGGRSGRMIFRETRELAKAFFQQGVDLNKENARGASLLDHVVFQEYASIMVRYITVFLAAAGEDAFAALREFFLRTSPQFTQKVGLSSKLASPYRSLLAFVAQGFLYPENNMKIDQMRKQEPLDFVLNAFLCELENVPPEGMSSLTPLFLNMMTVGGEERETLNLEERAKRVLIPLLSASMDSSPQITAQFISRKLGRQIEGWGSLPGMEDLTAQLSSFLAGGNQEIAGELC